jgi:hypothetical protein
MITTVSNRLLLITTRDYLKDLTINSYNYSYHIELKSAKKNGLLFLLLIYDWEFIDSGMNGKNKYEQF